MRLAVVASHPIQYHAPLFRELARRIDMTVYFAHQATPADQSKAGFGVAFTWDINLLDGYDYCFLENVAQRPGLDHFSGCDTPEIAARLAEGSFDAVLIQGWHLKAYLQASYAAKRIGLPLLARGDSQLSTPRTAVKKAFKAISYPALLRLFDAALYVGKRSHAYWLHYRYPETRLFFSPHCIDTDWFATRGTAAAGAALRTKLGLNPERKTVLFAGKLVPFKRPLDLVEALGLLNRNGANIALVLAGAGELESAIDARAHEVNVPVCKLGFCNQTEMPAVYAASDVLVLPSDGSETWGLVANEALACGRPVVLSDAVGAGPDLVTEKTGRIFPLTNASALASAIGDLLASPPSPEEIAAKSRAYSPAMAAAGVLTALAWLKAKASSRASCGS